MTRTTTLIALGLLLATTLSFPGANAALLLPNCTGAVMDALDDVQPRPAANQAKASLVQDCPKDIPDSPDACPQGDVGIEPACIRVNPRVESCPKGYVGAEPKCILIPAAPTVGPCPADSVGVVLDGRETCVEVGLPQGPQIGTCPSGSVGVTVDRRAFCVLVDVPEAPEAPRLPSIGREGPSCEETDDDVWPGGSKVSCRYSCPEASLLAISVSASDPDAGVYGDTSCADQDASCESPTPKCAGTSKGVTREAGENARCEGYTNEANSSPVQVICYSLSPTPPTYVTCYLVPQVCQLNLAGRFTVDDCVGESPTVDHEALLGALEAVPSTATGVAFLSTGQAGSFVQFGPGSCVLGSF